MGETSKDVLALLTQLMPGFLTAWVVYGLTSYTKPAQFERVIQALVYSFIVNALVAVCEWIALEVGKTLPLGVWSKSSELVVSAVLALILGVLLSYYTTNDEFFRTMRKFGLSKRTVYPSEWFGAFADGPKFVVLHLTGARRISGYPIEWPTEPTQGHFRLTDAAWLNDNGTETVLDGDESILISAKDVEMVEFLKDKQELANGAKATESTSDTPTPSESWPG
jgi:Family of unknown function (DUF6338)